MEEALGCAELEEVAVATLTVAERLERAEELALVEGVSLELRRGDRLELGLDDALSEGRLERVELLERLLMDDAEDVVEPLGESVDESLDRAVALRALELVTDAERDGSGEELLEREGAEERLTVAEGDAEDGTLTLACALSEAVADDALLPETTPELDGSPLALVVADAAEEADTGADALDEIDAREAVALKDAAALRDALRDARAEALAEALLDSAFDWLSSGLGLPVGESEETMVRVGVGKDGKADGDADADLLADDDVDGDDEARAELVKDGDAVALKVLRSPAPLPNAVHTSAHTASSTASSAARQRGSICCCSCCCWLECCCCWLLHRPRIPHTRSPRSTASGPRPYTPRARA